ncbi:39S ribosomal protein L34, mitochondrial [Corvus hawaiiensis]|uniref:39S ribosomal protein L34, mitochondrial n=1 Tax=Corvus hawaiiensis TaxID=134902 RepID=UPI002019C653|nr:39S ribosomal protein L34, mitochondrial [Corvus hawaiiensis]
MGSGVVGGWSAMAALGSVWGCRLALLHRSVRSPFPLLPNPLEPLPSASNPSVHGRIPVPAWNFQQIRGKSRGNEYQPNNWKRKRTHGWIKRISSASGIAVILRRMLKGRKSLSH